MTKSKISDWTKVLQVFFFIAVLTSSVIADISNGKAAYEVNCKACHLVETTLVGPSLIEISKNYPVEKINEFLSWTKFPGKKNPLTIQMPSMAHLSDQTLEEIHAYIHKATEGKKEKRRGTLFTRYLEPERKLPYVVRGFFPYTSPASIAVVMKNNISAVWDAEACRFRYAWKGKKTNLNSNFGIRKLGVEPFYKETADTLWVFSEENKREFLGYRLIKGYPEFHYRIGDFEVRELVVNGPSKHSVSRKFSLSGSPESITLNLSHEGDVKINCNEGVLNGNLLTMEGIQNFTLNLTWK